MSEDTRPEEQPDAAELQLLSQIRNSLRSLPDDLIQRMERARGAADFHPSSPANERQRTGGKAAEQEQPAWYDPRSPAGATATAYEKLGFAVGRLIPEFGQLASLSQSLRGVFEAFDNLRGIDVSEDAGRQAAGARELSKSLGPLTSSGEQKADWARYGSALGALDNLDAPRPEWTKTADGLQAVGGSGPPLVQPAAPLPPIPGLQSAPVDDGSGPGARLKGYDGPIPGVEDLQRALAGLNRQEKAASQPRGLDDVLMNLQRQAMGWSGGEGAEHGRAAVENLTQPRLEMPGQEQGERPPLEILLGSGRPSWTKYAGDPHPGLTSGGASRPGGGEPPLFDDTTVSPLSASGQSVGSDVRAMDDRLKEMVLKQDATVDVLREILIAIGTADNVDEESSPERQRENERPRSMWKDDAGSGSGTPQGHSEHIAPPGSKKGGSGAGSVLADAVLGKLGPAGKAIVIGKKILGSF